MARIPEDEIERLKREVSIQRLAQARGVVLKPRGKDLVGLCLFHEEKTPSMLVSPTKNIFHCFGCGAGGSVVDWVMKAEGVSFRHALEILRGLDGASFSAGRPPKQATTRKLPCLLERSADDQALLNQVIAFYHEALVASPEALAYLENRGLRSREMIDRFRLGYANRTLGYRLPAGNRQTGAELRARLEKLGILRETGHEHLRGSLVIPILDDAGNVLQAYGRKIGHPLRAGTPLHLYLPGPFRGVFNIEGLRGQKEVILCEALIDALTFWCAGWRNVTASYGTNGFTDEILQTLLRCGVERVLIALDRDAAGDKAAQEIAARLQAVGIACYRIEFPKGMDANEYAQKVTPAEKSLGVLIRSAAWMGDGEAPPRSVIARLETPAVAVGESTIPPIHDTEPAPPADPPPPAEPAEAEPEAVGSEPSASEPEPAPAAAARAIVSAPPAPVRAVPPAPEPEPVPSGAEGPAPATTETSSPLVASPPEPPAMRMPPAPAGGPPVEVKAGEVAIRVGDRRYRVRGLDRNKSREILKVNLRVDRGDYIHVDTLDLYGARHRQAYIKEAAAELRVKEEVIRIDLGRLIAQLEEIQDQEIQKALAPSPEKQAVLTDAEKQEAMELLRDPHLLDRILRDFERCGVVGEETNKLTGYIAAVSRKLDEPLAVIVQSSSAAGKSALMDAILAFAPEEDRVKYSALTGQALYYMKPDAVRHKILAIVEEEGAERASYALKLLLSEGELSIASAGKNPETGAIETRDYKVEGPIMSFLTTTATHIDDELQNRCMVLAVDEAPAQTRAIHTRQRQKRTLAGLVEREQRGSVLKLHQNAQRLLRRLPVVNPLARSLTFLDTQTRMRRDHEKYLTLIDAIALLFQYQRPVKTAAVGGRSVSYIEATREDIDLANRLAPEVLGRSLDDLPPQTRRFLKRLQEVVKGECQRQQVERGEYRFGRWDIVKATGWSYYQVRVHLDRLVDYEMILVHRGGRGQPFLYELLYDGSGEKGRFLLGLIESPGHEGTTSGLRGAESGLRDAGAGLRGHCGALEGGTSCHNSLAANSISRSLRDPEKLVKDPQEIGTLPHVQGSHNGNGSAPAPASAGRAG